MKTRLAWIATLGVQALLLVGMVAREEFTRINGTPVVLAVDAVDPMDLLSGRYVSVPLKIRNINLSTTAHDGEMLLSPGETVFVRLEDHQGLGEAVELATANAERPGGPWARASVATRTQVTEARGRVELDYGVDRFYIPETGQDPSRERDAAGQRYEIRVAARIGEDGRIVIEDLLVNGEPYSSWNARPAQK